MRAVGAGTPDSAALDSQGGGFYYHMAGMPRTTEGLENRRERDGGMTAQWQGSDGQQGPKCK